MGSFGEPLSRAGEPLTPHVQKRARKRLAFSVGARKKRTVPFGRFAFLQGQASSRHAAASFHKEPAESYLVDPASSHTLVLKIKPCMSKCSVLLHTRLRTAHYNSYSLFDGLHFRG